jgi:2,4-dienoyl-CoA reductase-like NADH-dependent reductase (Old Yellow Enzyme family)
MSQNPSPAARTSATLGQSFTLPCGAVLRNRIIKAAMTEQMSDADHRPTPELIRLYERWGRGGSAMLLTGNIMIDARALEGPRNVVVEDERDIGLLGEWSTRTKADGIALWAQISHPGRQTPRGVSSLVIAPSAVALKGYGPMFTAPRAATEDEIRDVIRRFAQTAAVLQQTGFDGVEVHAAHGYLISSFLSPSVNQRTDDWGGTPEKRMRLLLEVVRAIRVACGKAYPVSVKLNSADFQRGGFTEEDSTAVVHALEAEGVDLLEISGGNYENPLMVGSGEMNAPARESTKQREAYFLEYARKIRSTTKIPLMLTGGLRTAATMNEILAAGDVDFVGLARPFALDPDIARKFISGELKQSPVARVNIGIRRFDDMLQNLWYQVQLRRMGEGREPDLNYSRYVALVKGLWTVFTT